MLFRDKPLSVIYVEEVLLRPRKILPVELTDEESLFKIMGAGTAKEREVLIGEFLGSLLSRKVIGKGIYLGSRDKENPKKNKQLIKILADLEKDIENKIFYALKHAQGLNFESIGESALISLDYLFRTRIKDSVLWHEQGLSSNLIEFRFENMEKLSRQYIEDLLRAEICNYLNLPFNWSKGK